MFSRCWLIGTATVGCQWHGEQWNYRSFFLKKSIKKAAWIDLGMNCSWNLENTLASSQTIHTPLIWLAYSCQLFVRVYLCVLVSVLVCLKDSFEMRMCSPSIWLARCKQYCMEFNLCSWNGTQRFGRALSPTLLPFWPHGTLASHLRNTFSGWQIDWGVLSLRNCSVTW